MFGSSVDGSTGICTFKIGVLDHVLTFTKKLNFPNTPPLMKLISKNLKTAGLTHKIDDVRGIKIGKRYARTDEIAIPYGITVDVQSIDESNKMSESGDQIENNGWSVTVRDRDSMQQCRVPIEKLVNLMVELCNGTKKWDDIYGKEFEIYGN